MATTVNRTILVGYLGQDPEITTFKDGRFMVHMSVATSAHWKDRKTGEWKENVEWHRVAIYNQGLCEIAESRLKKGSCVYVEGRLETSRWEDPETKQKRKTTKVVVRPYAGHMVHLDGEVPEFDEANIPPSNEDMPPSK